MEAINPDIQGSAIFSVEGLPIASALARDVNDGLVSAMGAAILSMSERGVKELARGELKRILIEGIDGSIILSKAGENAILCTLVRSGASLGMVFLNIDNVSKKIEKILSGDYDGDMGDSWLPRNDSDDFYPYPYIFNPPSPPREASAEVQLRPEYITEKKEQESPPYCKHCGADLPKGQSICQVCGKKVI
jgi:predicted regulator of Ras-like GTPase activity (Roadblock/LC7/MglB family)